MSYYIDTTLKMTFGEYNKFVSHCKKYIDDDVKHYYEISNDEIENGEFIDKLFSDFEMNGGCIAINALYKYGSVCQKIIDSYVKEADEDDERYECFGYASIGEEPGDVEMGGCIDDAPFIAVDSNMCAGNKRLKPGVLKIIID